ncbi:MAG: hypothetical protein LUF90_10955 [Rikenellaceae bacterium]|nr:hypothetical protein [Rikenellaceae bacterium]
MKKIVLGLLIITSTINTVLAQHTKTMKDKLENKIWVTETHNGKTYIKFRNDTISSIFIESVDGKEKAYKPNYYPYYFSNSIDFTFNPEKMEKLNDGKYYVFEVKIFNIVHADTHEILKITDEELHYKIPDELNDGRRKGNITIYKAFHGTVPYEF